MSPDPELSVSKPRRLWELLGDSGTLTIVCHDNPDPDCLASAVGLGTIAAAAGIDERHILYSGEISHQQNRALVNLLDIELEPFRPEVVRNRPPEDLLAFVDHSIPGENNRVPPETSVDIVIDHHPVDEISAQFVDNREAVGATATIMTEYIRALPIEPTPRVATALLFAIRRETLDFLRGVTRNEYEAAAYLHEYSETKMVRQLSTPAVSSATVDTIAHAIENRQVTGSVLISQVGRTSERDALPQAADYLMTLEGVETTIVFGLVENTIQISARSTDSRVHIGSVLDSAFDDVGSAGGHREMAGGTIELGIFSGYTTDDAQLMGIVDQVITARLLNALNIEDADGG
ncbi:DHH family phosphoesterase [Haloarcula salinisoli]|uniref:Bifunctional oligoribonuclease/PAP phosphatase NrnA n=1 Tax=Haloarcula salinisoli TaxID=2487746 RepID=A0A8J8C936_9EURY|nr:bifunctional oligoribonuclease/PAP phosphatase NrnA [Halomicroarcula salinisoli]MBX0284722.1 bifunctional oligoribonuclease/PAP phosphatase NrnA [Halomicroarcula salinisoli]MBX0303794.1 bifunctional oligoribonuclease/PAP phosphatase NrnA [Halomicroarcula salinisoli]